MRRLALTIAVLLLLAAPAAGWLGTQRKSADLDGDGTPETVQTKRVHVSGVTDKRFDMTAVVLYDTCGATDTRVRIAGPQDNLVLMRLRDADARPGREVFVDLRSGAASRLGEARVVAWRAGSPCSHARDLFKYKSDHHTRTPRGGSGDIAGFDASYRRRRGSKALDVLLVERFQRRGEPSCCGSIKKTTLWRYSASRDRYRVVRTRVKYGKRFRP